MELRTHYEGGIEVPAPLPEVFKVLADVPDSAAHFPEVERLESHGAGYTWHMKRLGWGKLSLQIVYSSQYEGHESGDRVTWWAIPGPGNAETQGAWELEPLPGGGTRVKLKNELVWSSPVPRLMRGKVEEVFQKENRRLIERYLQNLELSFNGGDGRRRSKP